MDRSRNGARGSRFHGFTAVAELKIPPSVNHYWRRVGRFHGFTAVAELKLRFVFGIEHLQHLFPRLHCRGRIEATILFLSARHSVLVSTASLPWPN